MSESVSVREFKRMNHRYLKKQVTTIALMGYYAGILFYIKINLSIASDFLQFFYIHADIKQ